MGIVLIVIALVALLGLATLLTYNRMVSRRNAVDNSWAQIEAALQRRHDLIPNLVEAVKGYASHEQQTFENVTKARSSAEQARGPQSSAAAEGALEGALGRLLAVAESYPELRATENFQQLQTQLSETEDQIQITRRVYNDTVQTYNTFIQIFPPSVIAGAFNFEPRAFYDAPAEAEAVPEVSFERWGAGAAPALVAGAGLLACAARCRRRAQAKSYDINRADVRLRLADDASLLVTERLSFDFEGQFEGAYREIPLTDEQITDVTVREGGASSARRQHRPRQHRPARCLRCGIVPGGARIVWHYRAADENRTFTSPTG